MPGRNSAKSDRYMFPPKSKRGDIGYMLNRYQRLAVRSRSGNPETERAADLALADLIIAAYPFLEMYQPVGDGESSHPGHRMT